MYKGIREHWKLNDCFRQPGPIQFEVGKDRVNYLTAPPQLSDMSTDVPPADLCFAPKVAGNMSPLSLERSQLPVELPQVTSHGINEVAFVKGQVLKPSTEEARTEVAAQHPLLNANSPFLELC